MMRYVPTTRASSAAGRSSAYPVELFDVAEQQGVFLVTPVSWNIDGSDGSPTLSRRLDGRAPKRAKQTGRRLPLLCIVKTEKVIGITSIDGVCVLTAFWWFSHCKGRRLEGRKGHEHLAPARKLVSHSLQDSSHKNAHASMSFGCHVIANQSRWAAFP